MTGIRTYRDTRGVTWRVSQWMASQNRATTTSPCLIFASNAGVRRVWDFPRDWLEMPDSELEQLSAAH